MITRQEWDGYTDDEKFQYVQVSDKAIEDRERVLRLVPECRYHGFCLPHISEWITYHLRQDQRAAASQPTEGGERAGE